MGFYSLIGFLRPAIYIFLLPLYISYFTEAEYAIYNLMIDFAAIAMILVSLKLNTAMVTHYYDYLGQKRVQYEYLRMLYSVSLFLGIITILVMYFLGTPLFGLIFKDEAVRFFPYGMIVVMYTVLFEANQCYVTFVKNEKRIWEFTRIMMTHVLSIVILQFIFIIVLERGVRGALEGILLGNILVSILILIRQPGLLTLKPALDKLKPALSFSVNLIPYLVIYWFLSRGGRFFLEAYTNLEMVAVFALLMTLAGVIILAVEAVVNGVRPFLFEEFALLAKADRKTISILCKMIINLPLLFVPLIILVSAFFPWFTSKELYHDIIEYMPLCCLLFFLLVISKLFYQQLLFAKRSGLITMLSMISLVVLIAGFMILIPAYEIWGVITATIIANLITAFLFFYFGQKAHYVHHSFASTLKAPLLVFSCIFALQALSWFLDWGQICFGVLQFFVAMSILIVINFRNVREYLKVFGVKA